MPWRRVRSRSTRRKSGGAGTKPPSPSCGSMMTAATWSGGMRVASSSFSASTARADVQPWYSYGKRRVIDLRRERTEVLAVRGIRRGHRQRQQRAAVERAGERDDALPVREAARDLHGVFRRFGAGRHEQRLARRPADERGEPLGERDVLVVHRDLTGHVRQARQLIRDGAHDRGMAMADVQHADAGGEVEVLAAVGVPDARAFGADDGDRMRNRKATGNRRRAPHGQVVARGLSDGCRDIVGICIRIGSR